MTKNTRKIIKYILGMFKCKLLRLNTQWNNKIYIGRAVSIKGGNKIKLGKNVSIRPYAQIWANSMCVIDEGVDIGERCRFSLCNNIYIGKNVLFSPNVYVTDCDHEYRKVEIPVLKQGIVRNTKDIFIGEDSFIGINTVIIGASIGKHCVIGANSVVTKDIPDYSVAVGIPANVIKQYDFEKQLWCNKKNG